jgi:hypothetical protein
MLPSLSTTRSSARPLRSKQSLCRCEPRVLNVVPLYICRESQGFSHNQSSFSSYTYRGYKLTLSFVTM